MTEATNEHAGMAGGGDHRRPADDHDRSDSGGVRVAGASRGGTVADLVEQTKLAAALREQMQAIIGDDDDLLSDTIEGETDLYETIDAAMLRLVELGALLIGIDHAIEKMAARQARFKSQQERLRSALLVAMETAGIKTLERSVGTLSLKPTPASVVVTSEPDIPSRFWKAKDPTLDKRELLSALKQGETIPGATLSNGGSAIQVKFS